jgi:glutaminyl-peptide cyclotransferase
MRCASRLAVLIAAMASLVGTAPAQGFRGDLALQHVAAAVKLGPRPAGSAEHRQLQAYVRQQLKAFGLTAQSDTWTASTPTGPKQMTNLWVRLPGTSGKAIAITGHYDTKVMPGIGFVGANDGGSSTGVLLELARVLAKAPRKDDLYLIWLDGEEAVANWTATDSLYGSRRLANQWKQSGMAKKVKALINVDMIGDRQLSLVYELNSTGWLRDLVWQTAHELGYKKEFETAGGAIEDDHVPFLAAGIPSLDLIDFDYGPGNSYWHTPQDTVDKLSARSLEVIGRVLLAVIPKLEARN